MELATQLHPTQTQQTNPHTTQQTNIMQSNEEKEKKDGENGWKEKGNGAVADGADDRLMMSRTRKAKERSLPSSCPRKHMMVAAANKQKKPVLTHFERTQMMTREC